uniref:Sfi1 spindle body domain-containing protein n=1 Tax=Trichobilharzia regenti TaxID=157069 RepID=A0AA85KGR2_TRIRE|nr:unnamed protein product [Trichobilharzia regenti]
MFHSDGGLSKPPGEVIEQTKKQILKGLNGRNCKYMPLSCSTETVTLCNNTEFMENDVKVINTTCSSSSEELNAVTTFANLENAIESKVSEFFNTNCKDGLCSVHNKNDDKTRTLIAWILHTRIRRSKNALKDTAKAYYRQQVFVYYINLWKRNYYLTGESTSEKHLLSAARAHNRRQLLNKALSIWALRTQIWRRKRVLRETALDFMHNRLNKNMINTIFQQWYQQIVDIDTAKKYNRYRILKSCLKIWSTLSELSIADRRMQCSAHNLHVRSIRQRYFTLWINYTVTKRLIRKSTEIAIKHYKMNQMKKCFHGWILYHCQIVDRQNIVECIVMKRQHCLLEQCLMKWKDFTTTKRLLLLKSSEYISSQNNKLLKEFFHRWVNNLHDKKSQEITINNFHRLKTVQYLEKVFTSWFKWSRIHRKHRVQTQALVNQGVQSLRIPLTQVYYNHWKSVYKYYLNHRLAQRFHSLHLLVQCFNGWLAYSRWRKKKLKLKYDAHCFSNQRIQKHVLNHWRLKLIEKKNTQTLESIALLRWSLCLQARVWKAWRLWIEWRHEKAQRRKLAAQRFIDRQTVDALRMWISIALNKRHKRHMEYCSKFWNNNTRLYNLILRVGTHWYWRTFSKRRHNNGDNNNNSNNDLVETCTDSAYDAVLQLSDNCHNNQFTKYNIFNENIHVVNGNINNNNNSYLNKLQSYELTPPQYPDFILSEIESIEVSTHEEFPPISAHTSAFDDQSQCELKDDKEIGLSTSDSRVNFSGSDVNRINSYMNLLEEKISSYKMMKTKYEIMCKRVDLQGKLKIIIKRRISKLYL